MNAPHPTLTGYPVPPTEPATLEEARDRRDAHGREIQDLQAEIAATTDPWRRKVLLEQREASVVQVRALKAWMRTHCAETEWSLLAKAYGMLIPSASVTCADVDELLDTIEARVPRAMLGDAVERRREADAAEDDSEANVAEIVAMLERGEAQRFAAKAQGLVKAAALAYAMLSCLVDDTRLPTIGHVEALLDEIEKHVPETALDDAEKDLAAMLR